MKKAVVIGAILGIAILALGVAGFAYAQTQFPMNPAFHGDVDGTYPYGTGMLGRGMMGRGGYHNGTAGRGFAGPMMEGEEHGPLHESMMESLAGALGISAAELEERHEAGETIWDITQELGISAEDFRDPMLEARNDAIDQAVADGVLSQEQGEWMLDHMIGAAGFAPGMMGHGPGGRGFYAEGEGPLHDYMPPAMADAFGLTVEDLEALHESGETLWDYAQEQGISEDEFLALKEVARTEAINEAVADGVIAQEQADQMLEHMGQGIGLGNGECHDNFGPGTFGPGMHGQGGHWNSQP
jgi:hypothetical protein